MRLGLKFIVFCLVGGTSALIYIGAFNLFNYLLNFDLYINLLMWNLSLNFVLAVIIAWFVSLTWNFFMNRNITFSAGGHSVKKQLTKHLILYIITTGINFFVAFTVVSLLGESVLNNNIAVICGIAVSTPLNFLGSLLWVFKKKK